MDPGTCLSMMTGALLGSWDLSVCDDWGSAGILGSTASARHLEVLSANISERAR